MTNKLEAAAATAATATTGAIAVIDQGAQLVSHLGAAVVTVLTAAWWVKIWWNKLKRPAHEAPSPDQSGRP